MLLTPNSALYPQYTLLFTTSEPMQKQPRKNTHPTRFVVDRSVPQSLYKNYHHKNAFWVPSKTLEENPSNPWEDRRAKQIMMIMQTIYVSQNNCWNWLGAKTGGYAVVSFMGKQVRTVKVLVSHCVNDVPFGLSAYRLCSTHFCVNPAHHHFPGLNVNVPVDPNFLPLENEEKFWTTGAVLPWQDLKTGIDTIEPEWRESGEAAGAFTFQLSSSAEAVQEPQTFIDTSDEEVEKALAELDILTAKREAEERKAREQPGSEETS